MKEFDNLRIIPHHHPKNLIFLWIGLHLDRILWIYQHYWILQFFLIIVPHFNLINSIPFLTHSNYKITIPLNLLLTNLCPLPVPTLLIFNRHIRENTFILYFLHALKENRSAIHYFYWNIHCWLALHTFMVTKTIFLRTVTLKDF